MDWLYAAKSQTMNLAGYGHPVHQLSEAAQWVIEEIAKIIGETAQFATVLTALRDVRKSGKIAHPPLYEAITTLQESAIMQALEHSDLSEQDSIELGALIKKHCERMPKGSRQTAEDEQIIAIAYEIGPQLLEEVFGDR